MGWLKRTLFKELGGYRFDFYGISFLIAAAFGMLWLMGYDMEHSMNDKLQETNGPLARAISRKLRLTAMSIEKDADIQTLIERAFEQGQAFASHIKPIAVIYGSTKPHVETGPPEVGPISVKNEVAAALVTIPADGKPYARAEITTTVTLPKFNFERTFTEPVEFDQAVISDQRPDCKPAGLSLHLPAYQPPRLMVALDLGANLGGTTTGYEVGARVYPRPLSLSIFHLAEARLGFYGRVESEGRGAAGVSILFK